MFKLIIIFISVVLSAHLSMAQQVVEREGNIFYISESNEIQLTNSGLDRQPSLSPNGELVLFVRDDPTQLVQRMTVPDEPIRSIWVISSDGSSERKLLPEGAGSNGEHYGQFAKPQFLSDGYHFVFWSDSSATSGKIAKSNLDGTLIKTLNGGNSLEVIRGGKYNDHLIVMMHKYFLGHGAYDFFWLLTPDGTEVGPISEDEFGVRMFKEYEGLIDAPF